ncbi:MAG: aminopeptidase N [Thalassotalea sp.]
MTEFTARYLSDYKVPDFSIKTVDLTFELQDEKTLVTNKMAIENLTAAKHLVLDGEQLALASIKISGQSLPKEDYTISDTNITIVVPTGHFDLEIITCISPITNTALEGLYKSGDAYCTQCEAEGFRRITYYLDRPDVLAVFTTKIIADKALFPFLLSNGNKVDSGSVNEKLHFVTWHDPHPKPCYLFALVAGDFDLLADNFTTSSGKEVALEIFVDKGNLPKASHAMRSLKASMTWDEETFGLEYDLDIYMIVAVDFFNMGAMENKGLNVFNSKFVLADEQTASDTDYFNIEAVIAHEYFHNWTGNRVTCRDWFQLSLKEGLTVFRDQQFSADLNSAAVTRIQNVRVLRSQQFAEDASPMAHPIRPEKVMEMNNFYTLTVYEKGAEVIRMLYTLLGKAKFRAGMDLYFKRFDGMAVTCDDFVNAMADASGIDLSQFKIWYSQSGTPLLTVKESYDTASQTFTLAISQGHPGAENKAAQPKHDLHIPIAIELLATDNQQPEQQLLQLTESTQTWNFTGYQQKPVVAFLANFTAPVKVDYPQSDDELAHIMVYADDQFCRWDAGQKLVTRYLKTLIADPQANLPTSLLSSFEQVLTADLDAALIAEQLTLPSFDEIADNLTAVDPDLVLAALDKMKAFLAVGMADKFLAKYQQLALASGTKQQLVANRALKNICLSYLACLPKHSALVKDHYTSAVNMTDALAAFSVAAKNNLSEFKTIADDFEKSWYEVTLVMDKWFSICAIENNEAIFERLSALLTHPLFTMQNPNRARSLVAAFMMNNPKYFHCKTGRGYQFLTDRIEELNEINPQIASRLITPLLAFKRYENNRKALLKGHLQYLAKLPKLSTDLQEKVTAALSD